MSDGGKLLSHRLYALLLAALMICACVHAAAENADSENAFVDPTLPENAIPWDEKHPELLDGGMLYARSAILIEASTG